jgi:ABC-type transport system involved in cytochrome bd biosynthesis fused ATPase/permease subunit
MHQGALKGPLSKTDLKDLFLLVRPRETFSGSIFDNLRVIAPELDDKEAYQALSRVGLDKRIASLPKGLDSELDLGGRPLSGAELNLLCLARAFIRRPEVLVLDRVLDDCALSAEHKQLLLDEVLGEEAPWAVLAVTGDAEVRGRLSEVLKPQQPLGRSSAKTPNSRKETP